MAIGLGGAEPGVPTVGAMVADHARRIELPTASADVDAGTLVAWHRDRDGFVVAQPRGVATWRVEPGEQLRIDPGAMGALIEATGASLRVEVHMNLSDARVIGASTLTAAAVAFVTVVVYEGHVQVASRGQTVNIEPGAQVELRPDQTPKPVDLVGDAREQRLHQLEQQLVELKSKVRALTEEAPSGAAPVHSLTRPPDVSPGTVLPELDRAAITATLQSTTMKGGVAICFKSVPMQGLVRLHIAVAPSGAVTEVKTLATPNDRTAKCLSDLVSTQRFAVTNRGGSFSYPFPAPLEPADARCDEVSCVLNNYEGTCCAQFKKCDADDLKDQGMADEAIGEHAKAVQKFERALKCKPGDARATQLAFMASCNMPDRAKARLYYQEMTPDARSRLILMCLRRGIMRDELEAPAPAPRGN
jgi:hypothetical protein